MLKLLSLFVILFLPLACTDPARAQAIQVHIQQPQLLLPVVSEPLQAREAKIDPEDQALVTTLRPLLNDGRYTEALNLLRQHPSPGAALLAVQGQIQLHQQQFSQAEQSFQAALQMMPDFVRAHRGLASVYLSTGAEENAIDALTAAITLGGGDAQLYTQLGFINLKHRDAWGAVAAYQNALMLNSNNNAAREGLLMALLKTKQLPAALALVDDMLQRQPDRQDLWLQRTNIALEQENHDAAIAALEVAIRLGNSDPANRQIAAQLHLRQKNYRRATDFIQQNIDNQYLDMNTLDQAVAWLTHNGQATLAQQIIDRASAKAGSFNSDERSLLNYRRAEILANQNKGNEAIRYLNQSVEQNGANGPALILLGQLQARQNNFAVAELMFERAEVIPAVKESALLSRAQLMIDQQDYPRALAILRQTQQEFPDNYRLADHINSLVNIVNTLTANDI